MGRKAIFFDAGNTLVHLDYALIARALRAEGIPLSEDDVRRGERAARVRIDRVIAGIGQAERHERDVMRAYLGFALEALGLPVTAAAERAMEPIVAAARAGRLWTVVEPGTAEFLAALGRRGYVLGVVSNSNGTVEDSLVEVGLRRHLAFVIDSAVVGVEKPDPRIFRIALERGGVGAEEAAYIGDLYHVDIRAAERAGLRGVLLDPAGVWHGVPCPRARSLAEAVALAEAGWTA